MFVLLCAFDNQIDTRDACPTRGEAQHASNCSAMSSNVNNAVPSPREKHYLLLSFARLTISLASSSQSEVGILVENPLSRYTCGLVVPHTPIGTGLIQLLFCEHLAALIQFFFGLFRPFPC